MQMTELSFADTKRFGKIILDYLQGEDDLKPFYHRFPERSAFGAQIEEKAAQYEHRQTLVAALRKQHESLPHVGPVIDRLADKRCFTVTTGHQLCLLTGPLYFIYKITSVIKLAKQLREEYPSHDFLPVFWMASEDHDFDEANHAHLFNKKVAWESGQGGAVGRMALTGMSETLAELRDVLGDSDNARAALAMIEEAYHTSSETVASATRNLVYSIFKGQDLIVIDGDDLELKRCFAPIMRRELEEQFSDQAISATNKKLEPHYGLQVNQREINLFYLGDQMRERIVRKDGHYHVLHTDIRFTTEQLEEELSNHPERFSPNVVLRPLYQEVILPNLAYIGGGGELSYWFQLKAMFEAAEVPFPVLMLRDSVLWVSKNETKKMNRLGLKVNQLFGDRDQLIKEVVVERSEQELSLDGQRDELAALFESIAERAAAIDPTLKKMVLAEEARAENSLDNIEKKLIKAEKDRHSLSVKQINNIFEKLFPEGQLQERHQNYFEFYLRYGDAFIDTLMAELDPLRFSFTVIQEPSE